MSEWQKNKLGNTGNVITGKTPSKDNPKDWGNEVLFITPSDYKNYRKKAYSSIRMLSRVGIERQKNRLLPPSSVLVTCIGSDMGKSVVNSSPCITNQQINAIIPDLSVVNADYLYYLTIDLYDIFRRKGGDGTAVPILNKSDFEKIDILLPRIPEQKAIDDVLSSLDNKIDLLHRQNKTLESIAESLFRQWFIEEAQDEWADGTIADLIEFNPHRKLSKGAIAPYLEMASLNNSTFNPDDWYDRAFSSGTKFINRDTLLARITPCLENGKTAYVTFLDKNQVGWGSTEYIVMRPKGELHPFFAYALARNTDFRAYAEGCLAGSSGRQRVEIQHLENYVIKIPSPDIVSEFNSLAGSITAKLHSNFLQLRTLEKLRDTLLPKLMSGEVRVDA